MASVKCLYMYHPSNIFKVRCCLKPVFNHYSSTKFATGVVLTYLFKDSHIVLSIVCLQVTNGPLFTKLVPKPERFGDLCFLHLQHFNPEDGSGMVLRNVGIQPSHYTAQQPPPKKNTNYVYKPYHKCQLQWLI